MLITRALVALLCLLLASCNGWPGAQSLGIQSDPDASKKALLVTMGFVVDAVGVYGHLCAPVQTPACTEPKAYQDAKLIAGIVVTDAQLVAEGKRSALAASIIFGLTQYQLVKTVAHQPGPTDVNAEPTAAAISYIDTIGAADLLISTSSQRVQDAYGVNTSVADLLAELKAKVAALP